MTSRLFAPTTALLLCFVQTVFPGWAISVNSQSFDPPYLSEMPSVDKVTQAMKTADPGETALRQIGAFYQLVEIIKTLSGRREFRGLTPDEARIVSAYQVAEYNVTQAADKQFPAPSGFRTFGDQIPYRFGRWDRRFGVEGIQTFKMFLSPALKAQFDSIVAGDNARREARNQEYQNQANAARQGNSSPSGQPLGPAKPGSTAEVRKCVESGRSMRNCMSESLNSGFYELAGVNVQSLLAPTPGLRMTGDYASAAGFRLIFLPDKVAVICRGIGSPDSYTVELTSTQALVKIQHGSTPVVFSLRADGKLAGPGGSIRVTGQVPSGSHTEETFGMTTQKTTRERQLAPGEQRQYPNATQNGPVWTVKEDATELAYGSTGSRTVTDYTTRTTNCTLGLLEPIGATPLPPDLESPMGILTAIGSGMGALMQGKSLEAATKQMLGTDDAPPPGLRMTGNYVGQSGFSIKFHPESATLSCGEAAHALRYSVVRSSNQTLLKVQDNTNPVTLQLKPDGSLVGDGTVQVDGRVIVGTTEDPNNPFVFAPRVARCAVGNLVAGSSTAVATGVPLSSPTASAPAPAPAPALAPSSPSTAQGAALAQLAITSGFPSQQGINPLAGKTVIVLKESFDSILAKAGWSPSGAPGSALTAWARACENRDPSCQKGIAEMSKYFVSNAKLDNLGSHTFQNARAGTYYVVVQTSYNGVHLVWDLRIDLRAGPNSITLDQRNVTPLR